MQVVLHDNIGNVAICMCAVQSSLHIHKIIGGAIFKKYLQCVLAARILTVDFVVCSLTVKKKIRADFDMSDRTIPL
jgi:hypothetical protein